MKRLEDIMEQARAYLKGRLSKDETTAFEQMLKDNPGLKKEVAFARLMLEGLEEVENRRTKTRNRSLRKWLVAVAVLLFLLGGWYFYRSKQKRNNPLEERKVEQVSNGDFGKQRDPAIDQAGGPSTNKSSDRATAVAWNSRGDIVFCGIFEEVADFGDFSLSGFGGKDIFLAVSTLESDYVWVRQIGGVSDKDLAMDITTDSEDNIIITGSFGGPARFGDTLIEAIGMTEVPMDFFIAKYDADGNRLWVKHSGGQQIPNKQTGPNIGISVTTDPFDNIIATGMYIGSPKLGSFTLPVGGPNEDMYLAKYSPGGELMWVKAVTGTYMVGATGLDTDASGNIYLSGFFGHHNLSGSATFGDITLNSFGGRDIFIAKYSPDGSLEWAKHAGSPNVPGNDYGSDIAVDLVGNCIVTGLFEGKASFDDIKLESFGGPNNSAAIFDTRGRDIFVAKYDTNGQLVWAKRAGGSDGQDKPSGIDLDDKGNAYITGVFSGKAEFGEFQLNSVGVEDAFIAKYSPAGEVLWIRQIGGDLEKSNSDAGQDIKVNGQGEIVVTGVFSGTMRIGDLELKSSGREDMFIIWLDTDGNILRAKRVVYLT